MPHSLVPPRTRCSAWPAGRILLLLVAAVWAGALTRAAEAARRHFDLPADLAMVTLKRAALQAGLEIVYSAAVVNGVHTQAVAGEFTPHEALDRMVANTPLKIVQDSRTGVFSVSRRLDPEAGSNPSPTTPKDPPSAMKRKNPVALLGGWLALVFVSTSGAQVTTPISANAAPLPTGTIAGRVFNPVSRSYLNNTRIIVEGSNLGTLTNESGEYRLANVPVGEARVTASFTGLAAKTEVVNVGAGQTTLRDFDLVPTGLGAKKEEVIVMEAFTIAEQQLNAQMIALNEQRRAPNIRNVVSADEFGDLGEGNVGEFLKYVPGVNIEYSSVLAQGVTIRGLPSSGTLVTLDGGQIASATIGSGDGRAVNLDALRLNNMSRIEVTKVPTPDLPANAQGGAVNIISKSGFERKAPLFSYRAYANFNSRSFFDTGFGERPGPTRDLTQGPIQPAFDFSYVKPVNEGFALTFSGGYSRRRLNFSYAFTDWDLVRNITSGTRPTALEALQTVTSGTFGFDWRIGKSSQLSATMMYADTTWLNSQPGLTITYGAGTTGGAEFVQGAVPGVGSSTMASDYNDTQKFTSQVNLIFRHRGPVWRLDASGHFGRNRSYYPDTSRGAFSTGSMNITQLVIRGDGINRGDPGRAIPVSISAVTRAGTPVDVLNGAEYSINSVTSNVRLFRDLQRSAKFNLGRDFNPGIPFSLKAGATADQQDRDLTRDFNQWTFRPTASVADRQAKNYDVMPAEYNEVAPRFFAGGQKIRWISNEKLYALYQQRPDYFVLDSLNTFNGKATFGKKLRETILAGYLRGDVHLMNNRLWIVGGVRFEKTTDEGEGPLNDTSAIYQKNADGSLRRNAAGAPILITTDTFEQAKLRLKSRGAHARQNYDGYYPSINANYDLGDNFVLRAAYARTIMRPNLSSIIPGVTISNPDAATKSITVVNTGLKPTTSDGYDLSLESYVFKGGTGSIGVFRKDLTGFTGGTTVQATPELLAQYGLTNEYLGYEINTQTNLDTAVRIDGIELSYRQSLEAFTPWAKGVQVFGTATALDISGPAEANFATYSPKTASWGVSYSRGRFYGNVIWSYLGLKKGSAVGSVNATTPAETYRWFPARTDVKANFTFRLYKYISLFGTGNNLTNKTLITYRYAPGTPDYAKGFRFQDHGVDFTLGLKGEF